MTRLVVLICLGTVLLLSCATVPPSRPASGWLAVLPPLGRDTLYLTADVASSRSLLEALVDATGNGAGELERIIGSLDRVHTRIRFFPGRPAGQLPELHLVALGKIAPGSVACRLNLDPSFERVRMEPFPGGGFTGNHWSYRTYWSSDRLQVAAPRRGVLFAAGGTPADGEPAGEDSAGVQVLLRRLHFPEAQALPAGAVAASESAQLFLFIPDPAALASAASPASPGAVLNKLPVRQGWITGAEHTSPTGEEGYELSVVFLLDRADSARSVEMLLRLMLTLWLRKIQAEDPVETLKAMTFNSDAESVRIDSLFLESSAIATFFQSLLPEDLGAESR